MGGSAGCSTVRREPDSRKHFVLEAARLTRRDSNNDDLLITQLRQRAIDVVGSVIPPGRPVALLDFPRHWNVGDSAIWLGEIDCLSACGIPARDVRYTCAISNYEEAALRRAIGDDGVILLHGGGNFGDLWNTHQRFRETVVQAFPANAIVMLPQSMHYADPANLTRTTRVFNAHRALTILVRDEETLHIAQREFRASVHLCPDLAFCLGPLPRAGRADRPIVYLARKDKESRLHDAGNADDPVVSCDWPSVNASPAWRLGDAVTSFGSHHSRFRRAVPAEWRQAARRRIYDSMTRNRVRIGCELLAHGRAVVTDRLHAHILSVLMGVPNVILDNSYGKLSHFHAAWTAGSALTRTAATPTEAFAIARAMST